MSDTNTKKYNMTVTGSWEKKPGYFMSAKLDDRCIQALEKIVMEGGGGKLVFKITDETKRGEKTPHGYIEYITRADVEEFKAKKPNNT